MFSNPTTVTNPLFPIDSLTQVVQVGSDADGPLRQEITLLPQTRLIEWNGVPIETISSQFIAYSGGRILEVAVDYFAQADDGSVWYFGEDVANYVDGVVDNHDGTWLAGKDGPPGMIMPADPQVGDVYRPENIPGLVFEEVVVISIDETADGPQGPITGCLLTEEHPLDGAIEDKTFAPGYGEFHAVVTSENEEVTVSTGVPVDAAPGAPPAALATISSSAEELVGRVTDRSAAESIVSAIASAWQDYRSAELPPLSVATMDRALADLQEAAAARDEDAVQGAAFRVAVTATDLRMRHQDSEEADLDRLGIVARRLQVDAAANDAGGSAGDLAVLQSIWIRVKHVVTGAPAVDRLLDELQAAADRNDLAGAGRTAEALRIALGQL